MMPWEYLRLTVFELPPGKRIIDEYCPVFALMISFIRQRSSKNA